uniref:Uncharacterized protein n=1 Tax=viral metagenome TaxID=1070528 RepID=A0A6C0B0E5_9ZZZZ
MALVTNCCSLNCSQNGGCNYLGCAMSLCDVDPASQYIKLKLIQNTVRVPASLYLNDLGALTVYQQPLKENAYVNWNQMSDRPVRSFQKNLVTGGSFYHGSSTKHTITRCRPGAGSPGGYGVDIKHNSYDRYLARIKGKGPARRGVVPPAFGAPIPFNPAFPIYGGKTMKTSIVGDNCNCPISNKQNNTNTSDLKKIYHILINPVSLSMIFKFKVGDVVYATNAQGNFAIGIVTAVENEIYTVIFDDESTVTTTADCLFIYFPCKCDMNEANNMGISLTNGSILFSDPAATNNCNSLNVLDCYIVNNFFGANSVFNIINLIKDLLPAEFQNFLSYYNT